MCLFSPRFENTSNIPYLGKIMTDNNVHIHVSTKISLNVEVECLDGSLCVSLNLKRKQRLIAQLF